MAMFFFVEGQRHVVPAITVKQALYNFYVAMREEDFNIETAQVIYSRMRSDLIDYESTTKDKRNTPA